MGRISSIGYMHRILNGAKPADLPVQEATRYQTVIKNAKAVCLAVPRALTRACQRGD
jgi:hypothetical protein